MAPIKLEDLEKLFAFEMEKKKLITGQLAESDSKGTLLQQENERLQAKIKKLESEKADLDARIEGLGHQVASSSAVDAQPLHAAPSHDSRLQTITRA
jgi:uncharacterized protein YlxW (UPF0749 family)